MKIPKEYIFLTICGLFLLAYVLEAVVDPLNIELPSPYNFLTPEYFLKYPFTSAVVGIRGIALLLIPLFLYSYFSKGYFPKAIASLIIGGLMQLYSLQEIATGTTLAPLEWSISLSLAGIAILVPMIYYLILGFAQTMKEKINAIGSDYYIEETEESPQE